MKMRELTKEQYKSERGGILFSKYGAYIGGGLMIAAGTAYLFLSKDRNAAMGHWIVTTFVGSAILFSRFGKVVPPRYSKLEHLANGNVRVPDIETPQPPEPYQD